MKNATSLQYKLTPGRGKQNPCTTYIGQSKGANRLHSTTSTASPLHVPIDSSVTMSAGNLIATPCAIFSLLLTSAVGLD